MKIKICLAGATGKMGSHLAKAISESKDLEIISAVAKNYNEQNLGEVLNNKNIDAEIFDDIVFALRRKPNILVDFSNASVVKRNVMNAITEKIHVVIGASGLNEEDLQEIHDTAIKNKVGVIAAANFSISAMLMIKFSEIAAKYFPSREIIEYSYDGKPDAPSGTARELAARIKKIKTSVNKIAADHTLGLPESRGAAVSGTQVHSVRLPGFNSSCEIIFGTGAERLKIRQDAIDPTKPYIDGALLAIRKVKSLKGLHQGLDTILSL